MTTAHIEKPQAIPMAIQNLGEQAITAYEQLYDGLAPNSVRTYKKCVENFLNWADQQPVSLHELNQEKFQAYIDSLKLSPASKHCVISGVNHFVKKMNRALKNPLPGFACIKHPIRNGTPTPLFTGPQLKKVFEAVSGSDKRSVRDHAMFRLAFECSASVGELAGLDFNSYKKDKASGRVFIELDKDSEPINLCSQTAEAVDRYIDARKRKYGRLFVCTRDYQGTKISPRNIRRSFEDAIKSAGLQNYGLSPDSLRLSRIVMLKQKGLTNHQIAQALRYKEPDHVGQMLKKYKDQNGKLPDIGLQDFKDLGF